MFPKHFIAIFALLLCAAAIHSTPLPESSQADPLADPLSVEFEEEIDSLIREIVPNHHHRPPVIGKIIGIIKGIIGWLRRHCIRDAVEECKHHAPHLGPLIHCIRESIIAHKGNCSVPEPPPSTAAPNVTESSTESVVANITSFLL